MPAGRKIAILVVGPEIVGGSQRCEVEIFKDTSLEFLAKEMESQLQFFTPGSLISLIETFDYREGRYKPLQNPALELEDRARVRVRCATSGGGPTLSTGGRYVSSVPNRYEQQALDRSNWGKTVAVDRELDAKAEQIRQRAASPEAFQKFTATTPDYGGPAGRAAMIGKHLATSSAVSVSSSQAEGSLNVDNARRVGAVMSYLNGPRSPVQNNNSNNYETGTNRASSIASTNNIRGGGGRPSSAHSVNSYSRGNATAATPPYTTQLASQQPINNPRPPAAGATPFDDRYEAAAHRSGVTPYKQNASSSRPQAYYGDGSVAPDETLTIFCVYNGVDAQRAKAITLSRRRPDLNQVLHTLESKFNTQLCLGYIDPDSGECEEVRTQAQFATILNDKSHRHDPNAGVTFQCWTRVDEAAEEIVAAMQEAQQRGYHVSPSPSSRRQQQQQQQQQQYNSSRTPTVVSENTPQPIHQHRGGGGGGFTPAGRYPEQFQPQHYAAQQQQQQQQAAATPEPTVRISQQALMRLQQLEAEEAARQQSARSGTGVGSARSPGRKQQQQQQPAAAAAARRGPRSVAASVISLQSASVLVTEDQLRDVFDDLDPEGCGFVTKAAVRNYFDKNVDDMGVPDAARKFEKMLAASKRQHELDFQEFAVVMLKVAQW